MPTRLRFGISSREIIRLCILYMICLTTCLSVVLLKSKRSALINHLDIVSRSCFVGRQTTIWKIVVQSVYNAARVAYTHSSETRMLLEHSY